MPTSARAAPRARRALLLGWLPPFAAWLLVTAFVLLVSRHEGWPPFDPVRTWTRWDSIHYVGIARSGYTLYLCRNHATYAAGSWCGNAGWFPAYPWIMGALHLAGLPLAQTGLAVAWFADLGALVLLWRCFLVGWEPLAGLIALAYAAVAPGLVYDYALFPLSLLCLFTVAAFACLRAGRPLAAGAAGALAALAYPVGLAFAPAAGLWLLLRRTGSRGERLGRAAAVALPTAVGIGAFALDLQLQTGHLDAYLLVQRKYGHHVQDPFAALVDDARGVLHGAAFHLSGAPSVQALLVALLLLCLLVHAWRRRASLPALDGLLLLWGCLAWLIPDLWESVSVYRGEAALMPLALLVGRLPRRLALAFAAAAFLLIVPMELLFERSLLV